MHVLLRHTHFVREPERGLEPPTYRLQSGCSTIELLRLLHPMMVPMYEEKYKRITEFGAASPPHPLCTMRPSAYKETVSIDTGQDVVHGAD